MSLSSSTQSTESISQPDILDALDRVLKSDVFADVPRLSRFLSFVVSENLAGRADRLKGFVIACEVFDKTDPTDAQTTTIVRVEAGRLRRRLADYYDGPGRADPLRISIPKGGYKPVFEFAGAKEWIPETAPKSEAGSSDPKITPLKSWRLSAITTVAILCVAGAIGYALNMNNTESIALTGQPVTGNPTLAVIPLEVYDNNPQREGLALEIVDSLISTLGRQPGLEVMALSSTSYYRTRTDSVRDIGEHMQVSHVVTGGVSKIADALRITINLHATDSGYVIWSDSFEMDPTMADRSIISQINRDILTQLGLVPIEQVVSGNGFDPDRYALNVQAQNLTHPPANEMRVKLALGIFETLISTYPQYAEAHAGAAYARAALVWWQHSPQPETDAAISREEAQRAITLDPGAGLAYLALGMLEFSDQNRAEAVHLAEQAIEVEPNNSLALSVLGIFKLWSGMPEDTISLIEKGIQLDPSNPRAPHWNILGVSQFYLENYEESIAAFEHNIRQGGPRAPNHDYHYAAAMVGAGRADDAAQFLSDNYSDNDQLGWQFWVYKNFQDKSDFDHLMDKLTPLGVPNLAAEKSKQR
jgi:adenylate cyclase